VPFPDIWALLPFKEFTSYLHGVILFHFFFMTCMHSSLITSRPTCTYINCYLPFLALKHITFTTLSNTYPISGYSIEPDSVYSLDFRVTKQRENNHKSFLLLPWKWENVVMLLLVVCRVFNNLELEIWFMGTVQLLTVPLLYQMTLYQYMGKG
jgi:hypothetical protein